MTLDITSPEAIKYRDALVAELEANANRAAREIIANSVTGPSLAILSVLGIDGRVKILDIIITECQKLKEELEYDTR